MHRRREHAKVGCNGHGLAVRGVDAVAHTGHIVAGGECLHPKGTNVLFPAGQGVQLTGGRDDAVGVQKIQCIRTAVDRERILFEERGKALDVVTVLVGDEDAVTVRNVQPQRFEGSAGGAHAFAHINDKVMVAAAHHAAVAGRAGIQ